MKTAKIVQFQLWRSFYILAYNDSLLRYSCMQR